MITAVYPSSQSLLLCDEVQTVSAGIIHCRVQAIASNGYSTTAHFSDFQLSASLDSKRSLLVAAAADQLDVGRSLEFSVSVPAIHSGIRRLVSVAAKLINGVPVTNSPVIVTVTPSM